MQAKFRNTKLGRIASNVVDFTTFVNSGVQFRNYLNLNISEYTGACEEDFQSLSFDTTQVGFQSKSLRYVYRPFYLGGFDNGGTASLLSVQNNTVIVTNPRTEQSSFIGGNLPQIETPFASAAFETSRFAYPLVIEGALDFYADVNDNLEIMQARLSQNNTPSPMGFISLFFYEWQLQEYERIRVLDRVTI